MGSTNYPLLTSFPFDTKLSLKKNTSEFNSVVELSIKGVHANFLQFYEITLSTISSDDHNNAINIEETLLSIKKDNCYEYKNILKSYNEISNIESEQLLELLISWRLADPETLAAFYGKFPQLDEKIRNITDYLFGRLILVIMYSNSRTENDKSISLGLAQKILTIFEKYFKNEPISKKATSGGTLTNFKRNLTLAGDKNDENTVLSSRKEIENLYAIIIGMISSQFFEQVVNMHYEKIQAGNDLETLLPILSNFKCIKLGISNEKAFEKSTVFLSALKGLFTKKVSVEFLQSLSMIVGDILCTNVNECLHYTEKNDLLIRWKTILSELFSPKSYKPIWKKFKDPFCALVMETGIICTGSQNYSKRMDLLDRLIKSSKIAEKREKALECIYFLVVTTIQTELESAEFSNEVDQIIEKVKEIYQMKEYRKTEKSGSIIGYESISILIDLGVYLSTFKTESIYQMVVLDLIGVDKSIEQQLIGLQLFNKIADNLHITFDKTYSFIRRRFFDIMDSIPTRRIYPITHSRESVGSKSNLSDKLIKSFRHGLEQLLRYADKEVGSILKSSKNAIEPSVTKEKYHLFELFRVAITCISRIPPANMTTSELIYLLVSKCFHYDYKLAEESKNLLIALLKTRPSMRVAIVEELAKYILNFSDDNAILLKFGLHLLREFFIYWNDSFIINVLEPDTNYIDIDIRNRNVFSASLFEAVGIVLLTSTSVGIRSEAIKLLFTIQKLNNQLPFNIAERGIRVYTVIERYEAVILPNFNDLYPFYDKNSLFHNDLQQGLSSNSSSASQTSTTSSSTPSTSPSSSGSSTVNFKSFKSLAVECRDGDQIEWAHCLGKLIENIRIKCHRAVSIAFCMLCDRLESLSSYFLPAFCKKDGRIVTRPHSINISYSQKSENLCLWRNTVLLACAIGDGDQSVFAASFGLLSALETNVEWVLQSVLPVFLHPNEKVRNSLHIALQYCKKPIAYSIPDYLDDLTEQFKRKEISKDSIRFELAQIYSNLAIKFDGDDVSAQHFVQKSILFISELLEYLNIPANGNELTSTLQSLRYHLFRICTGILNHEVILENELRNKLIQYSLQYCGYGPYQQENLERIKKYKENMTEKIKDNEQIEKMKNEFYYFTQLVKYWANKSIPFILSTKTRVTSVLNQSNSSNSQSLLHHQTTASSSATSNVNTSNNSVPTGQGAANNAPTAGGIINQLNTAQTQEIDDVFQYATSVFTSCEDVIIKQTGRNSIIKTLNHVSYEAQERIIDRCIDECYTNKVNIVKEFFLVIFYAITKKSDLQFKLTNIVNLSFYIMSDNDPSLRKLATDLLYWISTRFYKTARNPILLFNSNSSSRYLSQLHTIAKEFSEKHEELRFEVIEDVMNRITTLNKEGQQRMIHYLSAWFKYTQFSHYKKSIIKYILNSVIMLTNHHVNLRPDLIQLLWHSIANYSNNVRITTNYLVETAIERQNDGLIPVFQKIGVFLAEKQEKIVYEVLLSDLFDLQPNSYPNKARKTKIKNWVTYKNEKKLEWDLPCFFPVIQQSIFTKGLIAIVMLGEIVLCEGNEVENHLGDLLLASFLVMDHKTPLIYESAKLLLKNIIFKLLMNKNEGIDKNKIQSREYKQLIEFISSFNENPLWKNLQSIQYSIQSDKVNQKVIKKLVKQTVRCLNNYNEKLSISIGSKSLYVAAHSLSIDTLIRSLQIFKYLNVQVDNEMIDMIIRILCVSLQNNNYQTNYFTYQINIIFNEIKEWIEITIKNTTKQNLLKLPKLFWIAVCFLKCEIGEIYNRGIEIIQSLFFKLSISTTSQFNEFELTFPKSWEQQFTGIDTYLLKGICTEQFEICSRSLLTRFILLPNSFIIDYHPKRKLLILILSSLPCLLSCMGRDNSPTIISQLSVAAEQNQYPQLANVLSEYQIYQHSTEGVRRFLFEVVSQIVQIYFPDYQDFTFSFFIFMLENGPFRYRKTILQIIEAFLHNFQLEDDFLNYFNHHSNSILFSPVFNHLKDIHADSTIKIIYALISRFKPHSNDASPLSFNQSSYSSFSDSRNFISQFSVNEATSLKSLYSNLKQVLFDKMVITDPDAPLFSNFSIHLPPSFSKAVNDSINSLSNSSGGTSSNISSGGAPSNPVPPSPTKTPHSNPFTETVQLRTSNNSKTSRFYANQQVVIAPAPVPEIKPAIYIPPPRNTNDPSKSPTLTATPVSVSPPTAQLTPGATSTWQDQRIAGNSKSSDPKLSANRASQPPNANTHSPKPIRPLAATNRIPVHSQSSPEDKKGEGVSIAGVNIEAVNRMAELLKQPRANPNPSGTPGTPTTPSAPARPPRPPR